MKLITKQHVTEGIRFYPHTTTSELIEFAGTDSPPFRYAEGAIIVTTVNHETGEEREEKAQQGDWILKGARGDFYPCTNEFKEATYTEVGAGEITRHVPTRVAGCQTCGGALAMIRGRYPHTDKREVCPTCLKERMEMIEELASPDYARQAAANPSTRKV